MLLIGGFLDCTLLIDMREAEYKSLNDIAEETLFEESSKFRSRFVTDRLRLHLGSFGKVLTAVMRKKVDSGQWSTYLSLASCQSTNDRGSYLRYVPLCNSRGIVGQ